jgi:hypothetical protein
MKNGQPNRVDSILSSLDQVQRATAPDYLYTRIKGRIQNEEPNKATIWLLRPVPLIGMLLLFLAINTALVWNRDTYSVEAASITEAANSNDMEVPYAVAVEYRLHDNVTFYDNGREISSR